MRRTLAATPSMRGVGVVIQDIADIPVGEWSAATTKLRLDRLEWLLLGTFAVLSAWVIGLDLGGVLSSRYLGMLVPGYTGRHTYDGNCIWSQPDCSGRNQSTKWLLSGRLDTAHAQRFVANSHARFVLVACGSATAKLDAQLQPLTAAVTRFGCASVIELRE